MDANQYSTGGYGEPEETVNEVRLAAQRAGREWLQPETD
jgi:hypothetical protein